MQVLICTPANSTLHGCPQQNCNFAESFSVEKQSDPVRTSGSQNEVTCSYLTGDKILFKYYNQNKIIWKAGQIVKRIGSSIYLIQKETGTTSRHINQIRDAPWHSDIGPTSTSASLNTTLGIQRSIRQWCPWRSTHQQCPCQILDL